MGRKKNRKQIAVADCETDPFDGVTIPVPFIWGYYDGGTYEEFTTTEAFIRHCHGLGPTILYAHNGGKFDWHFILDYIDDFSQVTVIGGRLAKFMIGEVEFRDSMNILPVSLKKMQKDEFDYNKMKVGVRDKHMAEIKRYLYHDCIYLYRYVMGFIDTYGLHLTQAGAALKTWEDMMARKAPNDAGGELYAMFSPYYYGGRCEPFMIGEVDSAVQLYDINSAYPFAMLSAHPFSLNYETISEKAWRRLPTGEAGACFIEVTGVSRGALPFRDEDNSLIFPSDNIVRRYKVTGWELQAALDTKSISGMEIQVIYQFDELNSFETYMHYFYELRQTAKKASDNANDLFAKLLMNRLYGKFGANPARYKSHMIVDPDILDEDGQIDATLGQEMKFKGKGTWEYAGQVGNRHLVQRPIEERAMRYYHVGCAASITGFVRAMLWRAMCEANRNGQVIYCDTDSMFITGKGAPVDQGCALGQWKHEATYVKGAIAGKKLYAFIDTEGKPKVASKGTRLAFDDIVEVANENEVEFIPEAPTFSLHHQPRFVKRVIKMSEKMKKLKKKTK